MEESAASRFAGPMDALADAAAGEAAAVLGSVDGAAAA